VAIFVFLSAATFFLEDNAQSNSAPIAIAHGGVPIVVEK
jgi:hypothetical protein